MGNIPLLSIIVHEIAPICIIGGGPIGNADLAAITAITTVFVAADSGADHLLDDRISPVAVIGDLDSISDAARARFADVLHHMAEQQTTDFEKVLMRVNAPCILALGFTGGRMDHALAVLNVMARHSDKPVVLISQDDASFLCPKHARLALPVGTRISLVPLGEARVDTHGLRWPVVDAAMHAARFISVSNETAQPVVDIYAQGHLLITLPRQHLDAAMQAVFRAE